MKKNKIKTTVILEHEITPIEYVSIARNFPPEIIPEIIASLDLMCEDWDITEKIVNHFLAVKKQAEDLSKKDPEFEFEFSPKKIKTELHHTW